jgi:xylan 1,4-beta-xylosidase
VTRKGDDLQILAWDFKTPAQDKSNRSYFTKVLPTKDSNALSLALSGLKDGKYTVNIYRTGFKANDAYTRYMEIGSPKSLTDEQVNQLKALTSDAPTSQIITVGKNGKQTVNVNMRENDVALITISAKK